MFKKLLLSLFKPSIQENSLPNNESPNTPLQEELKFRIFWIITVYLKNPSPRSYALIRLIIIIVALIVVLLILKGYVINFPAPKKTVLC